MRPYSEAVKSEVRRRVGLPHRLRAVACLTISLTTAVIGVQLLMVSTVSLQEIEARFRRGSLEAVC